MLKPFVLLTGLAAIGMLASPATAEGPVSVQTPKVLAGEYVDTTSVGAIVEALFKSKKDWTDEQKVINFYHWYRRMVYPYRYMASDRRDVLKSINTAGFNLCGSQAAVATAILRAAGYATRPAGVAGEGEWGHTVWEVKYDGRWHLFDAMTSFYVLTRDNPPHVASIEEVVADATLVSKAVEEKRCGPEYIYTERDREITRPLRARFKEEVAQADVPWSILTTRQGTMVEFWNTVTAKKQISAGREGDAYGGHITPGVLDIRLKANERYVRLWHGVGKWMTGPSFRPYSPQNMAAGDCERFDSINFRYYEPYRQANPTPFNKAVYRTYGNGWLEWMPANAAQLAQGATLENLKEAAVDRNRGFALFTASDAANNTAIVLPVKSPYAVVEIELEAGLPAGSKATLSMAPLAGGKPGAFRKLWASADQPSTKPDAPTATVAGDLTTIVVPLMNAAGPFYEYQLRLEVANAGEGMVGLKRMKTTFQLNPMALPGLTPGANKIRVGAAEATRLSGGKLVVSYNWFEAPEWKEAKSDTKELTDLPAEYEIKLPAGEKLPKMKSLELFLKAD